MKPPPPEVLRSEWVRIRYPSGKKWLIEYAVVTNFENGEFHHFSLWQWGGSWEKSRCVKVFDPNAKLLEVNRFMSDRIDREVKSCLLKKGVVEDSSMERSAKFIQELVNTMFRMFEE